ncbi:MAG: hypothetical protein ACI4DY_13285 [Monoglobaceae bacterium]
MIKFTPMETDNYAVEVEPDKKLYYICDRRACETCRPECTHTSDIRHAENFELTPNGSFAEKENKNGGI